MDRISKTMVVATAAQKHTSAEELAKSTFKEICCRFNLNYHDRHSTLNNGVRDAIRRGAAENEVQKHEEKLTGVCKQMSTLRRRYEKLCKGDDVEDCTHKQRYEESYESMVKVLQQNT